MNEWGAQLNNCDIRVNLHCFLCLCISKYFSPSPVNHPVIKVSLICSATNTFASISRRVAHAGFLFTTQDHFFLARSYLPFCFTLLFLPPSPIPCMFSPCALPLFWREKGWLIGGDRWLFKFGLEPIPPLVLPLKVDSGGRVKGVVPSPRGANHSGRQAKHLSCRVLIKDLAMYLPYFSTTFTRR